jgi:hypothetical protein
LASAGARTRVLSTNDLANRGVLLRIRARIESESWAPHWLSQWHPFALAELPFEQRHLSANVLRRNDLELFNAACGGGGVRRGTSRAWLTVRGVFVCFEDLRLVVDPLGEGII